MTPKIAPSGHVQLRIETESAELAGGGTPLAISPGLPGNGDGGKSGVVQLGQLGTNKQSLQTTVILPDAGTVVIRTESSSTQGPKPAHDTLWILTAHAVRNDKKLTAPAPAPPFPITGETQPYPVPSGPAAPPVRR